MLGQDFPLPDESVRGGVERVISTLLPILARHVDIALFVPGAARDCTASYFGVPVVYRKGGPGPGVLRYWSLDAMRMRREIGAFGPDIVHLQGLAGRGVGLPYPRVFTPHGLVDRDLLESGRRQNWVPWVRSMAAKFMRAVEDRAQDAAGNIVAINPYVREMLPGIERHRIFDIANPIDPIYCNTPMPRPSTPRDRIILTVGRVGLRKNTLASIEIAAEVLRGDPTASLVICGAADSPAYLEECRVAAAKGGVSERVRFVGNLTISELIGWMDRSACLLLTSRQETAPLAISEANARGLAVVAPHRFGIKHMIRAGQNGYFLPEGGTATQADTLRAALNHRWDREAIAVHARAAHDPENVVAATIEAYRAILGLV